MKYQFVTEKDGQYYVAPAEMYAAVLAEVRAALDGAPMRRDQMALLDRIERTGNLEVALEPTAEMNKGKRAERAQMLGLLRKWFTQELAHDLGVDGISLDIAKDEAWRD